MRSEYSVRAVSVLVFLPLLLLPVVLSGQSAQEIVVPLKNWAAPLYWQPNQSERETAGSIGLGIRPLVTQLSTSALTLVAITPCRLVDTRGVAAGFNGLTPFSGPSLAPSTTTTFPVQSAAEATADTTPTPCGTIPSIAQAYSFNITAIPKTSGGIAFVTIWPSGGAQPAVSTINDGQGVILANAAIVPAGTPSGGVNVINSGPATMDLIIDMNGYYAQPTDLEVAGNIDFTGTLQYSGSTVLQMPGGLSTFNTSLGFEALSGASSGSSNTAVGGAALNNNSSGAYNTATGVAALQSNSSGSYNTAFGADALSSSGSGSGSVAIGYDALSNSTATGIFANNTAVGYQALQGGSTPSQDTGYDNTATGYQALQSNTTGVGNTALGAFALISNTTGLENTATGEGALESNSTGLENTATGTLALASNTTGSYNTSIGYSSLASNTTGINNIAVGYNAATNVSEGNSNNIHIGAYGASADNGVTRIGDIGLQTAFFAAGIGNANVSGVPVVVNTSTGQLGIASSSRRFKENIQDMSDASDGLMRLRPVTFRYKQPFDDGTKPIQYGLIAEEVAEVYPDLVARSADGQIETVKYQMLPVMLLNEVQRQQEEIGAQKEQLRRTEQRVEEQDRQIQAGRQRNQNLEERLAKLEAALASTPVVSRASGGH
jgi:hypothetical protein